MVGVTVTVPLLAAAQEAAVVVNVPVTLEPVDRKTDLVPVHPLASMMPTVWKPAVRPVNVVLEEYAPPSILYVYGAVPLVDVTPVTVMVPLFAPEHVTLVELVVNVRAAPAVSVAVVVPEQRLASVKVIVYAPAAKPLNVLLACPGPPFNE